MNNLATTLFALVKSNKGMFKSEAQANLILSATNGEFVTASDVTFGEFAGKTNSNTRQIQWSFSMDNQGVTKIVKTTSKTSIVWFERTEAYFAKLSAKAAKTAQDNAKTINSIILKVDAEIAQKAAQCETMATMIASAAPAVAEVMQTVLDVELTKIEALKTELVELQAKLN